MPPGRRRHLTMPQKALLHDPDLVGIAPVSPTRDLPSRKDLDLGSELMVGHKVGLIIAVEISSDGSRRRLTESLTQTNVDCLAGEARVSRPGNF